MMRGMGGQGVVTHNMRVYQKQTSRTLDGNRNKRHSRNVDPKEIDLCSVVKWS